MTKRHGRRTHAAGPSTFRGFRPGESIRVSSWILDPAKLKREMYFHGQRYTAGKLAPGARGENNSIERRSQGTRDEPIDLTSSFLLYYRESSRETALPSVENGKQ